MDRVSAVRRLLSGEDGADATEYALLAALVAVALIGGASYLGTSLNVAINGVANKVPATVP